MNHDHRKRWSLLLVALALAIGLSSSALAAPQAQTPSPGVTGTPTISYGLLRMVHAAPGAPSTSVYLNDDQAFCGLSFGSATRYEFLDPGTYTILVGQPVEQPGTPAALATSTPAPVVTPGAQAATPEAAVTPAAPAVGATSYPGCCPGQGPPQGVTPQYGPGRGPMEGPYGPGQGPGEGPRGGQGGRDSIASDPAAQATTAAGSQLASGTVTVAGGNVYSGVLVGASGSHELLVLPDDLSAPAAGQAKVRFVNASPNAPSLDLVESGGQTVASNVAYKAASGYTTLAPGSVDLEIHAAGSSNVLATLPSAGLADGVVYTVYAMGTMNGQPPLQLRLSVESVDGMPVPIG